MLHSVNKLAQVGADFAICPDNTIHEAYEIVKERSPIPWLHIAEEVANEAKTMNYKCLGILGTSSLMGSSVYSDVLTKIGISFHHPEEEDKHQVDRIIFDELVNGLIKEKSRTYYEKEIDKLQKVGCDAVILGCTEIPLLVVPETSPLPVLDSTRLLARAALKYAVES